MNASKSGARNRFHGELDTMSVDPIRNPGLKLAERQSISEQTGDFIRAGGRIAVSDNFNNLIGYKTSDHPGPPEIHVVPAPTEDEVIDTLEHKGEIVCQILKQVDGYAVKNFRSGRTGASTHVLSGARDIANRQLHAYKAMTNRKKVTS